MGSGEEHWRRVEALEQMGVHGERDALPELLAVLAGDGGKECWHTRTAAIRSLVALNAVESAPVILKTLARDKDPEVREVAVEALGHFRFAQATRLLERLAADQTQPDLAAAARRALDALNGDS